MGSTNTTSNYSLSQFTATDKPAWLQDYNGDMLKIDTAIKAAKTAGDSAQSTADSASGSVTTITNDLTSLQTTVTSLNSTVTSLQTNVNTINSLIGNGTPTTNDHTIIGAINEMNAYRHLRKAGRVDVSLAATHKACVDLIWSFLNSNFPTSVNGKLLFSTGGWYDFNGPIGTDYRARSFTNWGNGEVGGTSLQISNGTSALFEFRMRTTGNTVTDSSSGANAATWCDIYVWE